MAGAATPLNESATHDFSGAYASVTGQPELAATEARLVALVHAHFRGAWAEEEDDGGSAAMDDGDDDDSGGGPAATTPAPTVAPTAVGDGAATASPTHGNRGVQPHILLIVCDDFGWMDVGFHGSDIATPFMDKLARDGARCGLDIRALRSCRVCCVPCVHAGARAFSLNLVHFLLSSSLYEIHVVVMAVRLIYVARLHIPFHALAPVCTPQPPLSQAGEPLRAARVYAHARCLALGRFPHPPRPPGQALLREPLLRRRRFRRGPRRRRARGAFEAISLSLSLSL